MKRIYYLITIAVVCALPKTTLAWGKNGHDIISQIAFRLLSDPTKQKVSKMLGDLTFEEAGMWMDDMRSNTAFDYMKPWHYINIEKGAAYDPLTKDNIIWELQRTITKLKDPVMSADSIKINLCILFHLIGDLHQPLHVGYGIDRGGNTISLTFSGEQTNLHRLWDSQLIKNPIISFDDCYALYQKLSPAQITTIKEIDIIHWMNESRLLLDTVYNFSTYESIDTKYANNNKPIIEKQLLLAGVRLANVLEDIFK